MSTSPKQFKLILVDIQAELCDHWRVAFEAYPDVEIHNAYFQKVKEFDCMVSPANSFGLMDGGIDLAIRAFYGMSIQYKVQKRIQKEFYGEQPVGTSMIVFTENEDYPFLAHTPTMRVPRNIAGTDNVYNAMFAMLGAVANHNKTSQAKNQHRPLSRTRYGYGSSSFERSCQTNGTRLQKFSTPDDEYGLEKFEEQA